MSQSNQISLEQKIRKHASQIPHRILEYLTKQRGLSKEIIERYEIGWDGKSITIPVRGKDGRYLYYKRRQDPAKDSESNSARYLFPKGAIAELFGRESIEGDNDYAVITEGEFDCLCLIDRGIPAVSGTAGVSTFKQEWIEEITCMPNIYVCFDNDSAGREGAIKLTRSIPGSKIVTLPDMGEGYKDITNFFIKCGKTREDFEKLLQEAKSPFEIEQDKKTQLTIVSPKIFAPMSKEELLEILGQTIKKDDVNKLITFACELVAFTEDGQFNVSYNAPSSTGKSYIPLEIASLFPPEDVNVIGYCSPTAFFHDSGLSVTKEDDIIVIHLDRKILIFLDQPHGLLLQHLRPLLSHDKREIPIKITDKTKDIGLRTKNILIRGFPSVIFCTAGLRLDEQEVTRFLLLSPEITQEKIRNAFYLKLQKESDSRAYQAMLTANLARQDLKDRIYAIRDEHIDNINIDSMEKIERFFMEGRRILRPRYLRDVSRVASLSKTFALLNLWDRDRDGSTIVANNNDIEQALSLWKSISQSQELNLPPYVFSIYSDVILPLCTEDENCSTRRQDIIRKHYELYERPLPDWQLRREILPMLEMAGLIIQEPDVDDKRRMLICLADKNRIIAERLDNRLRDALA